MEVLHDAAPISASRLEITLLALLRAIKRGLLERDYRADLRDHTRLRRGRLGLGLGLGAARGGLCRGANGTRFALGDAGRWGWWGSLCGDLYLDLTLFRPDVSLAVGAVGMVEVESVDRHG